MKVYCVDDKNQPSDVLPENRVQQEKVYIVLKVVNNVKYGYKSFKLKEVDPCNEKYSGYKIQRFRPVDFGEDLANDIEKAIEHEVTIGELAYEEEGVLV